MLPSLTSGNGKALFSLLTAAISGLTATSYGFEILSSSMSNGVFQISVEANTNCYYVLERGTALTNIQSAVQAVAGTAAPVEMEDTNPPSLSAFYRVQELSNAPAPTLVSFLPPAVALASGGSTNLVVSINQPAPPGGTVIDVTISPSSAGTAPATVTIPAGGTSAGFTYADLFTFSSATVSVTLDATTLNCAVTADNHGAAGLVINEVDYDSLGSPDGTEFVELYNSSASPATLGGLALVFINGNNNLEYFRQPLSGTLPAGAYLVLSSSNVVVAAAAMQMYFTNLNDNIQNGAPDGIALFNTITHQMIDAVCYEGGMTAAQINGEAGTFSLVEHTAIPTATADSNTINASLIREPNGTDTDDSSADWKLTKTVTPGAANIYTP